mmetsp:Transcript_1272/g.2680  ORF Transcript_1272/g.2680 Transcript_1272/m.2680 type:complete len:229 (+) Transcript_1272:178-864(+)
MQVLQRVRLHATTRSLTRPPSPCRVHSRISGVRCVPRWRATTAPASESFSCLTYRRSMISPQSRHSSSTCYLAATAATTLGGGSTSSASTRSQAHSLPHHPARSSRSPPASGRVSCAHRRPRWIPLRRRPARSSLRLVTRRRETSKPLASSTCAARSNASSLLMQTLRPHLQSTAKQRLKRHSRLPSPGSPSILGASLVRCAAGSAASPSRASAARTCTRLSGARRPS